MSKKIKILYLSASPNDQMELSVDREFRAIYEKVDRNLFKMISVSGTQASAFQTVVLKNKPEIIHFSGHASFDELFFENDGKKSQGVSKNSIISFFNNLNKKPQLVFFNACRTAENLESLSRIINFVVATERPVFDAAAVSFATKFYEFLSPDKNVRTAFNHAQNEFNIRPINDTESREAFFDSAKNKSEAANPNSEADLYKLFIREGVDEDAIISRADKIEKEKKGEKDSNVINIYKNDAETINALNDTKFRDFIIKK